MAKVLGIGGVFFKAADPQAVRDWYARVLGFEIQEWGGVIWPHPAIGHGNWSVFEAATRYYDPSNAPFMVNFIVDDLDGVLAKARDEGAEPLDQQDDTYGRFAWLMDPAGVKIELWQPPATGPEA
ncbi:MAG TPA: VOC family protein [Phenylobacterium sp.]|jgi:catechol 2,3-dioxygenase-like lactoylglutathione lyase family enzyme|nr:VOC family protein [Phenylobacterium sp.]